MNYNNKTVMGGKARKRNIGRSAWECIQ